MKRCTDQSDHQKVKTVKSLNPWKKETSKLHPKQETRDKPLNVADCMFHNNAMERLLDQSDLLK